MIFWIVPLLVSSVGADTIPCPVDNPDSFHTKPLNERPNLATILQNGHMPYLNQATLPTSVSPGISVELSEGFVGHPFRTLGASLCDSQLQSKEFIRCIRSKRTSIKFTNQRTLADLLEEQALLELSAEHVGSLPRADSFLNPSWEMWKEHATAHLASDYNCTEWGYSKIFTSEYSCVVDTRCQELDAEFLTELTLLPVKADADLEPYLAFTRKWGYGTVYKFRLGAASLRVASSSPNSESDDWLHMARVGGAGIGEILNGNTNASVYTPEDCQDPEPTELRYQRWDEFLDDNFYFVSIMDDILPNRTEIQDNFSRLYANKYMYPDIYGEIRARNLSEWDCEITPQSVPQSTAAPTAVPSGHPSDYPTVNPTDSTDIFTSANGESGADLGASQSHICLLFLLCFGVFFL